MSVAPSFPDRGASMLTATGLLELGMYREALDVLDSLPTDMQALNSARRLTLQAATSLGQWKRVLELAMGPRHGNSADRSEAARAFHALAAESFKRGREQDARKLIGAAVSTDESALTVVLEDERFPEKFRAKLT